MCGIIAVSGSKVGAASIETALRTIKHRGPDDQGIFVSEEGDCHLGHVRLSIIDLSPAGHQPMRDDTGRFVISFNGEIYNYQDLKKELETKFGPIRWKSHSDTEVIVEGFARLGLPFLSRLNGIFAIAIYDRTERLLRVLRDPLGIKPLFITEQMGGVFLCSELKGLLAFPQLRRTLRPQSLAEQLAFMYVPEPHCLYREFRKVTPGRCLTFSDGKEISSIPLFEHLRAGTGSSSEREIVDLFAAEFAAAVARQLMADVPVSLMLSGGLDSSAVAHEVVRAGGQVRDAFTISFSDEDRANDRQSDDLHYAGIIAAQLGLTLRVIEAKRELTMLLPRLSAFLEDGIADPAALNTYLICEAARKTGVKVMLTGQGADEYLGGYRRYLAERMVGWLPEGVRPVARFLGRAVPAHVKGRFNATMRRLKRLLVLAGLGRNERVVGMYTWNSPDRVKSLFVNPREIAVGKELLELFDAYRDLNSIEAMMRVDQHYDLMSLNLTYTDRMSMAVGVEARVPFLDFDLVRLMNSIPAQLKMKYGVGKFVLKKAMEEHLPSEVVYREKAGFAMPIRAWMQEGDEMLRYHFDADRVRRQGIFSPDALQVLWSEQVSGKYDHANTLFSMLCIQVWLDDNGFSPH